MALPVAAPRLRPLWDKDVVGAGVALLAAFFIDAVAEPRRGAVTGQRSLDQTRLAARVSRQGWVNLAETLAVDNLRASAGGRSSPRMSRSSWNLLTTVLE